MIKRADKSDIMAIEEIFLDAVKWMNRNGIPNKWTEQSMKWDALSKQYSIDQFYLAIRDGKPAGCVAITDVDATYWPDISKGESLYVHKLAVKRSFAGTGVSKELIDFIKAMAAQKKVSTLRLDCNYKRQKLCQVYEKQGFAFVNKILLEDNYEMALYVCQL